MSRASVLVEKLRTVGAAAEHKWLKYAGNEHRIRRLRARGLRIGEDCLVYTLAFSSEPYLVEIGNRVAISSGCEFITHDASGWIFDDFPDMDLFGTIKVGDHVYFGLNCTILPNTVIGSNCIIGTGAVVRGVIPDGSVVMGNPARVVMQTELAKQLFANHKNRLETRHLPHREKQQVIRQHFARW